MKPSGRKWIWIAGVLLTFLLSAGVVSAAETEDPLMGYLEQEVNVSHAPMDSTAGRNRLSGLNRKVYDLLKSAVTEIAEGRKNSTEFSVTMKELGLGGSYTAADLGVKAIVSGGSITEAASAALQKKADALDSGEVLTALLYDCPYEMYWYDKVAGSSIVHQFAYGASYNQKRGEYEIAFGDKACIQISLRVSADYAASAYRTDTKKINAVQTAIANAKAIVAAQADQTDYEKLLAYKKAICDRASYNTKAAGGGAEYGNPWQLIWVFDDDPDTKVVCEGYSKAFQFLCDSSSFSSSYVESRLVSGKMTGGTGAGPHMWNLVTMDDGKNYLADVTNSDTGTVGSSGTLFLTGLSEGTEMTSANQKYRIGTVTYEYDAETIHHYGAADLLVASGNYDKTAPKAPEPAVKQKNTLTAKGQTVSVKASVLKKKALTVKASKAYTVSKARGDVTYAKKSGPAKIKVAKNGTLTLKKGLKKGSYQVVVQVTAAGNDSYQKKSVNVTVKVKVK